MGFLGGGIGLLDREGHMYPDDSKGYVIEWQIVGVYNLLVSLSEFAQAAILLRKRRERSLEREMYRVKQLSLFSVIAGVGGHDVGPVLWPEGDC